MNSDTRKVFLRFLLGRRERDGGWVNKSYMIMLGAEGVSFVLDMNIEAVESLVEDGLIDELGSNVRLSESGFALFVMEELAE